MSTLLAISTDDDIHARAIQHAVNAGGSARMHIFDCSRISGRDSLRWSTDDPDAWLRTTEGVELGLQEVDLIWWRRISVEQCDVERGRTPHEAQLVNNDCRGSLGGMLGAAFGGVWVSPPAATVAAGEKLRQLRVAAAAGFRVPRTVVTQSRDEVERFVSEVGRAIVKPVVGAPGPLMFTQFLDHPAQFSAAAFAASPAIYQEYIPGTRHIRLNSFGDDMFAALIESSDLDWRPNLAVPVTEWAVPEDLQNRVASVLAALGLRMGIVDLKLTQDDEPVWLEVNPQGQFLFLEPLTGQPLTRLFADFLVRTAAEARS